MSIFRYIALSLVMLSSASATTEDNRGSVVLLYPADLNLYGFAYDVNNSSNNTYQVQVCWDDPTFKNNCDTPIHANTTAVPFSTCSSCRGFHYPMPTRTIGTVTPRDGKNHLMYIKVLSQTKPGVGDKPLNGSPWPFTYKNGSAAAMWTANLETSPTRLLPSQLAVLVNSNDPYSTGASGTVVCTVGSTAVKDDGVAGYYIKRHNVPCANVSVVSVPVAPVIPQPTFNSAIVPVVRALSPSLQAIAIAWIQPSAVSYTSGGYFPQSISGTIANGGMVMEQPVPITFLMPWAKVPSIRTSTPPLTRPLPITA